MIEKSFAILFFLRKPKGYIKGEIPIVMRITVNHARKEIGTKHSCEPDRWNNQAQRVRGTTEKVKTLNAYLDSLERKVHEARLKILEGDKPVSPQTTAGSTLNGGIQLGYLFGKKAKYKRKAVQKNAWE